MDFSQLKNFIRQNGDRCIMIENGAPSLVVLSFSEYEKLIGVGGYQRNDAAPRTSYSYAYHGYKKQPNEDEEARETIASESVGLPVRLEDIRLEDLPI